MADVVERKISKLSKKSWWWPAVATSLAGAAVVAFRGCWHRKMSWPIGMQGYSYQVCMGCGIKRLFNEATFTAYGPYSYDLDELRTRHSQHLTKNVPVTDLRRPMS